ncbi:glycosyltransferase family 4 protein [Roseobacteraceae bacterium S113]
MAEPIRKLCHAMPEALNLRLRWRMHLLLSRTIARHVHRQLTARPYDVLFCSYSFQSLMNVRAPGAMRTVFTADATPTTYKRSEVGQSFGSYLSVSRALDPLILGAERKIFSRADLLLWPTDWLKSGADSLYGLSDRQSRVIPWGANIETPPKPDLLPTLSRDRPVKLVLIGRDFWAKGGGLALETVSVLRAQGVDAQLHVIGGTPPSDVLGESVTYHGNLNKAVPDELATFQRVISSAHFLMQPSFESYGFAFCEASAYGLPSLCLRVGGVPVRDGVNGHALAQESTARDFARVVATYLDAPDTYRALRQSARQEFEDHLNWDAWGRAVDDALTNY